MQTSHRFRRGDTKRCDLLGSVKKISNDHTMCHPWQEMLVFQGKTLAFLGRGSHRRQDPRVKKSHCFSKKNKHFLARG